jgi:uncharacterized protein YndB with AHSA1/START domain
MAGETIAFPQLWADACRRLWNQRLDRLSAHVDIIMKEEKRMDDLKIEAPANEPVLYFSRTLKAPRALIWKALSEPEHVVGWWGPHGHKNEVVGGKWRIKSQTPDGTVIVFFGEYREIVKPERVTQTFSFDQLPEGVHSLDTVILEDHGETTVYRGISNMPDIASRDGMIASGMERGMRQGFERLDALLEDWMVRA